MKLVTYRSKKVSEARIGVISNGQIVDIFQLGLETGFDFPISMLEFIDQGPDSLMAWVALGHAALAGIKHRASDSAENEKTLRPKVPRLGERVAPKSDLSCLGTRSSRAPALTKPKDSS